MHVDPGSHALFSCASVEFVDACPRQRWTPGADHEFFIEAAFPAFSPLPVS